MHNYIVDYDGNLLIYPKEAQLIANVIYFSFKRSYCTLEAQDAALKSLHSLWNGWQNIAQTRLDPSKQQSHQISNYEKQHSISSFWSKHDQHLKIGKIYTQTVNHVAKGNFLLTVNAKDSIINMRNQAKAIVAQAIVDVKNYIGQLFYTQKKYPKNYKKFNFLDYLWKYIPQLAMGSFVEANKANDKISEEGWKIVMQIQQVGKTTWQMIEQERASFYLAFYKAIWHIIKNLELENDYLKIAFDQNGPLPIDNQHEFLPNPAPINLYNPTVNLLN